MKESPPVRLNVAFNGDDELIALLAAIPGVESVFGRMSLDVVGGGRPSFVLANLGSEQTLKSIDVAHAHGLKFHYLLNSPCMGNLEMTRDTNHELGRWVDRLVAAGIDGAVVAMPYLLDFLKHRHPSLPVAVSSLAYINSPQKARRWEERGADRLILAADLNRNFRALSKIRESVKCELELFANSTCVFQCPVYLTHGNANGHASSSNGSLHGFGIDYHSFLCMQHRLQNPHEFVRGRFIRPEDLDAYAAIGIDVFKLSDRVKVSPWLVRAARAYSSRRYDGNLADLICLPLLPGEGDHLIANPAHLLAKSRHVSLKFLQVQQEIDKCPHPVTIDNRKLDGFLQHYVGHDCENSLCGVDCKYCETVAARAVAIDPDRLAHYSTTLKRLSDMLVDQSAFAAENPATHLITSLVRTFSTKKNDFGAGS